MQRYVAQEFVASSPDAEVLGALLFALTQNMKSEEVKPFLRRLGLDTIDPQRWYPQQLILDMYRTMAETSINLSENLVAIGMKAADTMPVNPAIKTLAQALNTSDDSGVQVLRNIPQDEKYFVVKASAGYVLMTDNTPYPADMTYGYLWALARRYTPHGSSFQVRRVENPNPEEFPGKAFEIVWD